MVALQMSPKMESLYGFGRQAKNLDNFSLKTLKLGCVAFHS